MEVKRRVCVVGLGYIGLPTALMLAANGNHVIGADINEDIICSLTEGNLTFSEDGLHEIYDKAVENGIQFQTDIPAADIYIIAVPTPYIKQNKKIDSKYLETAFGQVLGVCPDGAYIVVESTVPPGTIDTQLRPMIRNKIIHLVHAPERIIPGSMCRELRYNNRVIGADDELTAETIRSLYQTFCKGEIITTDIATAEMSKVVENTYRDINIAFANELTKICRTAELDVYEVIRIANMHPRVNILSPGPGVGGHCISVDPWFLVGDYPGLANIILAARKINDSMPEYVLKRISEIMALEDVLGPTQVGFYGLTYKEDVDDIRESPTLQMLEHMRTHLALPIKVYDPMLKKRVLSSQVMDFKEFLERCRMIVVLVGHRHMIEHQDMLEGKIVLDTKNVLTKVPAYHL